MATQSDNLQSLRDAGFTIKTPLPDEYQEVLDGLTSDEVRVLIQVKEKFDKAQAMTEEAVGPYKEYFVPF